jgi:hypothetical protein
MLLPNSASTSGTVIQSNEGTKLLSFGSASLAKNAINRSEEDT